MASSQWNNTKIEEIALTVDTSAYAANDVVGGLQTINVSNNGNGGIVRAVNIIDADNENVALDVYFFYNEPSTIADQDAFAPTTTDHQKLLGKISIAADDYTTINSNSSAQKTGQDLDFAGNKLYFYVVTATGSTPTYTASDDLSVRIVYWANKAG